jgi:PAS domain-containing protein
MLATLMQLYEALPPEQSSSSSSTTATATTTPASADEEEASTGQAMQMDDGTGSPQQQQQKQYLDRQTHVTKKEGHAERVHCFPQPMGAADFDAREISYAVLDSIGEGVVVLDAKLRLRNVNNGAVRMLGYPSGRALLSRCRHLRYQSMRSISSIARLAMTHTIVCT